MKPFIKKPNKGFTLTETLVATTIFTLSILALFSNISKGISDINMVKNRAVGTYLAQEGVEYIRNLRDTYMLDSTSTADSGWTAFNQKLIAAGSSCQAANGCYFDDQAVNFADASMPITDLILTACDANCPTLSYNSSSGRYNYVAGGTATTFRRRVQINQPNSNEIILSVTVSWTYKNSSDSITLSERLYKWIE